MPTYIDARRAAIQSLHNKQPSGPSLASRLNADYAPLKEFNLPRDGFVLVTAADTPYTPVDSDYLIIVDTAAGVVTLNLPEASAEIGRSFLIKAKADAAAYPITTQVVGNGTIDGLQSVALNVNYAAATVVSDGTEWLVY